MAYRVPTFPITAGIWEADGTAARLTAPCNVAWGHRATTQGWYAMGNTDSVFPYLLFPAGTDVRDNASTTGPDHVEVPVGSGRWYIVDYVNDVAQGFPNEFRFAVAHKQLSWPTPLPGVFIAPASEPGPGGSIRHLLFLLWATLAFVILLTSGPVWARSLPAMSTHKREVLRGGVWCPYCYEGRRFRRFHPGHLGHGSRVGAERKVSCMAMNRRQKPNGPVRTWEDLALEEFIWQFPCLGEFLARSSWEEGASRIPGTLLLFWESGTCKAALHDRDGAETLFASGESLAELLASVETHLCQGTGEWRKDRGPSSRKTGRGS